MIEFSEIFLSRGRTGRDMQLAGNSGLKAFNSTLKPSSFKIILTAILLNVKSSYVITFAITIKVVKKFFKGKIVFVVGLIFYDRENYFL